MQITKLTENAYWLYASDLVIPDHGNPAGCYVVTFTFKHAPDVIDVCNWIRENNIPLHPINHYTWVAKNLCDATMFGFSFS